MTLPQGWAWAQLGDVCTKVQDGTHFSPQVQYDELGEGRYLYITAKNIKADGVDLSNVTYIEKTFHDSIYTRCNPEQGDVLLTKDGVKTGVATVNQLKEPFSLLSSVALLKPDRDCLDSYYLKHYLNSPVGFKMITGQMTGTAIKRIVLQKVKTSLIPVPPFAEQKRIVSELERYLPRIDAGVAALKRAQANLKRYKASVLKAVCEGRLVPQDPNDEPASALLERILAESWNKWEEDLRAKGKDPSRAKYVEPKPPDMDGLPELPKGWCWVTVEQLCDVGTGATPLRSKPKYYDSGTIPWVTSGALNELFVDRADEYVTELALQETNVKIFPSGTLLVAMYGEGKTRGKVSELRIDAATNQACAALLFDGLSVQCKLYVKTFFQKNYEDIRRLSSGGVQPNLNLSIIKHTGIPLPPLTEQRRIVVEVERRLSVVQEVGGVIAANLARAERLRQSILKQAFEGKLVPQDANDEPASVLLERIRTQRAKVGAIRESPVRKSAVHELPVRKSARRSQSKSRA